MTGPAVIRHAVVTGAGGFIGLALCAALKGAGVRVTALHRRSRSGPWDTQLLADLRADDLQLQLPGDADTVFHLAGHAHARDGAGSESLHRAVSVGGTRRVLAACSPRVRRFVFFSSVKAMGETTPVQGVDESYEPAPTSGYGRARFEAERVVLAAAQERHVAVLRLPLVYGPGVKGNLERLLRAVRRGRAPLLPELGNRRSMVHVEDVARAAWCAATLPAAQARVYLLSDGADPSPRQLVETMYRAAGRSRPVVSVPLWTLRLAGWAGDRFAGIGWTRFPVDGDLVARLSASARYRADRARDELGWSPCWSLERAVPHMLASLDR